MEYKFSIEVLVNKALTEDEKTRIMVELGKKLQEIIGDAKSGTVNVVSKK